MSYQHKHRLWLFLLVPVLLLIGWYVADRHPSGKAVTTHPVDRNSPEKNNRSDPVQGAKVLPTYRAFDSAGVDAYDLGYEYQLAGIVTSTNGDVLPGATVAVYDAGPQKPAFEWPEPVASDTCDSAGRYLIRLVSPMSTAVIGVFKEGYATLEDSQRIMTPGTITKNFRMNAAPACVTGFVSNKDGAGVAGASVMTSIDQPHFGGELDLSRMSVYGHSDRAGEFSIKGLPEDRVHFSVRAARHLTASATVELKAGPCGRIEIRLQDASTISMHVRDPQGRPIASAMAQSSAGATRADSQGRIELNVPTDIGPLECTVSARGYISKTATLNPQAPPQRIVLDYGDLFTGRVISQQTGNPLSGARVSVIGSQQGPGGTSKGSLPAPMIGMSEGVIETDADGRFAIQVSHPPVTAIWVSKRGYVEKRQTFDRMRRFGDVQIGLIPADGGIFGRAIEADGQPVQHFTVLLREQPATGAVGYSRPFESADGRFRVMDVPPGLYNISVSRNSPGAQMVRIGEVEIRRGYYYGEIIAEFSPGKR